jgi:hypothetical protein
VDEVLWQFDKARNPIDDHVSLDETSHVLCAPGTVIDVVAMRSETQGAPLRVVVGAASPQQVLLQ